MVEKTVKVEFDEQSKKVVTKVKIEVTGDSADIDNEELVKETVSLFGDASSRIYLQQNPKRTI